MGDGGSGEPLYAVYADHRLSVPAGHAWAGLGWVQDRETEAGMETTLNDLKDRRPGHYGPNVYRTAGRACRTRPVAAVVVAAFHVEPW